VGTSLFQQTDFAFAASKFRAPLIPETFNEGFDRLLRVSAKSSRFVQLKISSLVSGYRGREAAEQIRAGV
jgi:hypothetical protein